MHFHEKKHVIESIIRKTLSVALCCSWILQDAVCKVELNDFLPPSWVPHVLLTSGHHKSSCNKVASGKQILWSSRSHCSSPDSSDLLCLWPQHTPVLSSHFSSLFGGTYYVKEKIPSGWFQQQNLLLPRTWHGMLLLQQWYQVEGRVGAFYTKTYKNIIILKVLFWRDANLNLANQEEQRT